MQTPEQNRISEIHTSLIEISFWSAVFVMFSSAFYIFGPITPIKFAAVLLFAVFLLILNFKNYRIPKLQTFEMSLVVLCLFSLISIYWAPFTAAAIKHFFSLIASVTVYFLLRLTILVNDKTTKNALIGLIIAGLISFTFGLIQVATGSFYMPDTEFRSIYWGSFLRANGLFTDPNYFGFFLCLVWPLTLQFRTKYAHASALALIIAVVLTLSRSAILILAIQLFFLTMTSKTVSQRYKLIMLSCAVIFGFYLILSDTFGIWSRVTSIISVFADPSLQDNSIRERISLIQIAYSIFLENFFTGVGFGNFQLLTDQYIPGFGKVYAHSSYLTILTETGIVGLSIYIFFLISTFMHLSKFRQKTPAILSFLGFVLGNAVLVGHYFPISYCWLALVVSSGSFSSNVK